MPARTNRPRQGRTLSHAIPLFALFILPLVPACTPPAAIGPVVQANHEATEALSRSVATDQALLRQSLAALLEIRRTTIAGRVHRGFIEAGLLTPALEPDHTALDASLAHQGPPSSALVAEVRFGRLTPDQAHAFLDDYAIALRLSDPHPVTGPMLARFAPLAEHDRAARAMLEALDAHAREKAALLEELDANTAALLAYAEQDAMDPLGSRALWQRITREIDDPALRDAAEHLLDIVLVPTPTGPEG